MEGVPGMTGGLGPRAGGSYTLDDGAWASRRAGVSVSTGEERKNRFPKAAQGVCVCIHPGVKRMPELEKSLCMTLEPHLVARCCHCIRREPGVRH